MVLTQTLVIGFMYVSLIFGCFELNAVNCSVSD